MIPYARQSITAADVAAVLQVLQSDFLTQGPAVPAFERALGAYCDAPHATAMNSATSALHLACLALGLGPRGRLWTSPNTFVASANCGRYCGAAVDFVDIDRATGNLDPQRLEDKLKRSRKRPDVVVPVHFAGRPCDMAAIAGLARRYGFRVIEDASHALGATSAGARVGNGRHSDITVFSFHPVKIITTGEGGMALTRDARLHEMLQRLRTHGITRDPRRFRGRPHGSWYYEQVALGYNFRMTDIQAALGMAQLARLDTFVEKRRALARRYHERLAPLPLERPPPDDASAWHLYVVHARGGRARRAAIYRRLRDAGIGANVHYIPVHLQPYYRALGFRAGQFPSAEAHYGSALTLPLYADLTEAQQDEVVAALERAL